MADTTTRGRGRRIELISPITYTGRTINVIEISAPKFDHVLRWGQGQITSGLTLLAEMTGLTEGTLRQMEYPDAEYVLKAFMDILPASIRQDIERGTITLTGAPPAVDASPTHLTPVDDDGDTGSGFDVGAAA